MWFRINLETAGDGSGAPVCSHDIAPLALLRNHDWAVPQTATVIARLGSRACVRAIITGDGVRTGSRLLRRRMSRVPHQLV
jgi:hypothetical protein